VQQVFADLRNRHLDRGGVLKDGQVEGSGGLGCGGADVDLHWTAGVVKAAKLLIAEGGRSATISAQFCVLATFAWIS
jgi:hypothetical protein